MGVISMKLVGEGTFDREDRRKAMRFAFHNAGVDCVTVGYKAPAEIDEAIENLNLALPSSSRPSRSQLRRLSKLLPACAPDPDTGARGVARGLRLLTRVDTAVAAKLHTTVSEPVLAPLINPDEGPRPDRSASPPQGNRRRQRRHGHDAGRTCDHPGISNADPMKAVGNQSTPDVGDRQGG